MQLRSCFIFKINTKSLEKSSGTRIKFVFMNKNKKNGEKDEKTI